LTNRWWSGTGGRTWKAFFSSSGSLFYPEKVKNIKKKFKFLHAFANLWDSGKSAALELEPKTFLILYLLIISIKNIYSLKKIIYRKPNTSFVVMCEIIAFHFETHTNLEQFIIGS
jgi:hypothetical protein